MSVPSFNSHNSIVKEATEPTHFTDEDADWVLGKIYLLEVQRSKLNQGEINGTGMQSPRVCYKLPVLDFYETELNNSIPALCSNPHPHAPAHL